MGLTCGSCSVGSTCWVLLNLKLNYLKLRLGVFVPGLCLCADHSAWVSTLTWGGALTLSVPLVLWDLGGVWYRVHAGL